MQQVIYQAGTAGAIYTDAPYDEDDSPSYPLDLYYNEGVNTVQVWSQSMAGGLPTSHTSGLSELKIATYRLDSAVSMGKRYARQARLDVVSKAVERMSQEILVKQERNAWAIILKALAEGTTSAASGSLQHVVKTEGSAAVTGFNLNALNNIMTRMKRINESFAGGTPANPYSRGITDLYCSPERMADIRSFAYNALGGSTAGASATDLPAGVRQEIFDSAGMQEIYGVNIVELLELGVGQSTTLCSTLLLVVLAILTSMAQTVLRLPLMMKSWLVLITARAHSSVRLLVVLKEALASKPCPITNSLQIVLISSVSMASWKRVACVSMLVPLLESSWTSKSKSVKLNKSPRFRGDFFLLFT